MKATDDIYETSSLTYKLRIFKNSNDIGFKEAIELYAENIEFTSLTNTNQVSDCVDRYNGLFPDSTFITAGLYTNKVLVGYCQFIYMKEEKLLIIDYMIIQEKYRGTGPFFDFINRIKEILTLRKYEIQYVVAEVNVQNNSVETLNTKQKTFIELLRWANFGVIKSKYLQPMLGFNNFESLQNSILMLYPADQYKTIRKETYLKIVETIYFKHYQRWYSLFLNDVEMREYTKHLHKLFQEISSTLSDTIVVNGTTEFLKEPTTPKPEEQSPTKKALIFFGFVGLLILLVAITISLKNFFGVDFKDQLYILLITALSYLGILSLFSSKAAKLLNKLLEKLIDK